MLSLFIIQTYETVTTIFFELNKKLEITNLLHILDRREIVIGNLK